MCGTTPEKDLAVSLSELGNSLNALPNRLETVSKEFKKIYPNGVFDVQISIDIRSNKDAKDGVLELGPTKPVPTRPKASSIIRI